MASDQWSRAKRLLNALLDAEPEDPEVWLDDQCDDPALRAEVKSLYIAHERNVLDDGTVRGWLGGASGDPDDRSPSVDRPDTGAEIGEYQLLEEVGLGGMSVVYRAERIGADFDQTVAVKLLQRRVLADSVEQRFRAERQVLASLDHPNIARLIDGGVTEGGRPYLVMEYVDGTPITQYADRNELGLDARLDLLGQVLEAVQAAHRQLVVHRDLKPANVLVTETEDGPRVKLLDFGIAKLLDNSLPVTRPETRTGHYLMTPSYAAPEQITGRDVTTATDVYQFGVLAYELLAGRRPFDVENKSATEIERLVTEEDPPRPSERAGGGLVSPEELRGDLDRILQKALRKEPERRYRSMAALEADLERHQAGQPVEARPATLGYRTKKFVQRHRWGVAVAVAFLVVISISGAVLVRQRAVAEWQRNRAEAEASAATQVSDFLVSLFEASDPFASDGETLSAHDLLSRGQERIQTLKGQPVVRARMLDAMGRAHRGLGNFQQADSLLQRALVLRRRALGDNHLAVAKTLSHLGDLQGDEYEWSEALVYYRNASSILQNRRAPFTRSDSLLKAEVLSDVSRALRNTGQPDSAETLMRRALDIRKTVQGPNHPDVWAEKGELAYILRESGSVGEAERLYRDVLAWKREHADSLDVATTLNNLGYLLRDQGKYERAERRYREVLRILEDQLGPAHPRTLVTRGNNLGNLYLMQDNFAAAEKVLREQLRAVRAQYPDDHWRVGKWAYILAERLLFRGQHLAEAEALLREGVRIYRASDLANRESVLEIQAILGRCLVLRHKEQRARSLLEESHAVLSADSVEAPVDLAHAKIGLGVYHTRRGHYARAESLLTDAHETFARIYKVGLGDESPLKPVRQVRSRLVRLYDAWGKPSKAQKYASADTQGTL